MNLRSCQKRQTMMKNTPENQFVENCKFLRLKKVADQYHQMVQKAEQEDMGFYEFLANVIKTEANASGNPNYHIR